MKDSFGRLGYIKTGKTHFIGDMTSRQNLRSESLTRRTVYKCKSPSTTVSWCMIQIFEQNCNSDGRLKRIGFPAHLLFHAFEYTIAFSCLFAIRNDRADEQQTRT